MKERTNLKIIVSLLLLAPVLASGQTPHLTVKTRDGRVLGTDATYTDQVGTELLFIVKGRFIKHPAVDLSPELLRELGLDMAMIAQRASARETQRIKEEQSLADYRRHYSIGKAQWLAWEVEHAAELAILRPQPRPPAARYAVPAVPLPIVSEPRVTRPNQPRMRPAPAPVQPTRIIQNALPVVPGQKNVAPAVPGRDNRLTASLQGRPGPSAPATPRRPPPARPRSAWSPKPPGR